MPLTVLSQSDMFEDQTANTLLCPCNAAGAMGAGVALAFKEQSEDVLAYYNLNYPKTDNPDLLYQRARQLHTVNFTKGRRVLLFCTKYHFKNASSAELMKQNLATLEKNWDHLKIGTLAMPAIGCGLGKLNWDTEIRPMLEHVFGKSLHEVRVHLK